MKLCKQYKIFVFVCFGLFISSFFCSNSMRAKEFVVVIDPGHGGQDPGAIGKISKEKNINLSVALKVGNLIKKNCKEVRVVYTRDTDVFIPLGQRAEIANNEKADLFISIHTNALGGTKKLQGASTWTLGLARSEENLEVAKRENAVMLYESDYKTRYAGFDPNSSESYIIFEFMQDKYMLQSVRLASLIQKQFGESCKRKDLGVHQAGFWVLKGTAMPSVLVELGFISTQEEERFLNTDVGTHTMAQGIYKAFIAYKDEYHLKPLGGSHHISVEPQKKKITAETSLSKTNSESAKNSMSDAEIIFKVQILTSPRLLPKGHARLKGLKEVGYYKEDGVYKYTFGATKNYNKILNVRRSIASKFKDSFIVAFKDDKRTDIRWAISEFERKNNKN